MNRIELQKGRIRRLMEHLSVFPSDLLEEFFSKVLDVEHHVDREKRVIEIRFTVDPEADPLSREMIEAFVRFGGSRDSRFIRLVVEGYEWDEVGVMEAVSAFLEERPSNVAVGENSITIHTTDSEKVNRHIHALRRGLRFIFRDKSHIEVCLCCPGRGGEQVSDVVEEKGEKKVVATASGVTKNSSGAQEGEYCCFKLETRVDHGGNKKHKAGFTDLKSFYWLSIANRKGSENSAEELFGKLRVDGWYRIKFSLNSSGRFADSLDGFLNEAEPIVDREDGLGNSSRRDESEFGRVVHAICTHSKNSAFDGLYAIDDIVEEAAARGHDAVGLTDAGSVQSFAELEKAVNRLGLKGLYGSELEIIPSKTPILMGGHADRWLENGIRIGKDICEGWDGVSYCVFDIETTGLYPFVDEIIQISAKRYSFEGKSLSKLIASFNEAKKKGGGNMNPDDLRGITLMGDFDRYVKIERTLSDKIVNLTNITQEKLNMYGGDVREVLKEFKEFVKGSILIAHNGIEFDVPFLNAHLRKHGIGELEETVLDTLHLSRHIFAEKKFKSHSLSAMAKKASIPYEETEAHNAVYDVNILTNLFFGFLMPELCERIGIGADKISTINEYFWEKERGNKYVWGDNVLVYVKRQEGVRDLYELVSLAHTKYYSDGVKLPRFEFVEDRRRNLVLVSNPFPNDRGIVGAVLKDDREMFRNMASWFDYVTIPPLDHLRHIKSRDGLSDEEVRGIIGRLVSWCEEDGFRWFFSGAVRYIDRNSDMERYAVLVNTKGIAGKSHYLAHSQELPVMDFKYTDDMLGEYRGIWDDEEWRRLAVKSLETDREFVDSIDGGIEVIRKKLCPPKIDKCSDMLRKVCEKKLKEKYGKSKDELLLGRYEAEINAIIDNDFSVIYWFSHLLVKESIDKGYLVGSRGSVGSSFVAYLAGISEVNPLPPHYYCGKCGIFEVQEQWKESGFDLPDKVCDKCGQKMGADGHDIPFETFLGFEGNKVPDIDLNFSGEYQIKAHNFLLKYFGEQKVFRAGTIGTMAEKTAAAVVEKYIEEKGLGKFSKGKKVWLADKIVDVKRTTGQHPGGILVVPDDMSIYDFSPINYPANDTSSEWYTTHFSFEDLHDALLKFDILGHDDPTTLKLLRESTGFDPRNVPCRDEKLVKLYSSCSVMGIAEGDLIGEGTTGALGLPEFGTSLTRKIIKACNPKTFADLIRISGFSHGTGVWKGNINELVKNGHALNSVITCRDDIMLYLLRMGINRENSFNITESIRKGRGLSDRYQTIMRDSNIPEWYIESAKKISYIFPKAHATAYVLMSWRIAYYKLYYPLAFYSAYFTTSVDSFDMEVLMKNDPELLKKTYEKLKADNNNPRIKTSALDKSKVVVYEVAYEFFKRGFKFENVCVNKSELSLFLQDNENGTLRIPLKAVSGCGEHLAKSIVTGRKKGFYRSLRDLNERGGVTNKTMEKLKELGVLPDGFGAGDEIFDESGALIKSNF